MWVSLDHSKVKKATWPAQSKENHEKHGQQVRFFVKLQAFDPKHLVESVTPVWTFTEATKERK
jgi:hypothetical protein